MKDLDLDLRAGDLDLDLDLAHEYLTTSLSIGQVKILLVYLY